MSEEKIEGKTYYRYRVFTTGGALQILSECPTRQELWQQIVKSDDSDGGIEFCNYANGVFIGINIRPSAIVMIDDFYGQAPVSESPARPQNRSVYGRQARVVIGQSAKDKR